MTSGNHMVDGADRILDAQDWQCPVCGHKAPRVDNAIF
jgi:rubrerythrin